MKGVLRKAAFYRHPPELVWEALTNGEALAQWLMPNTFKPQLGHEFQFRVEPMPLVPGTTTNCRVVEFDPPRRMVWSWEVAPGARRRKQFPKLMVAWDLAAKDGGTLLTLTQTGDRPLPLVFRLMMSHGWKTMMNRWLPRVLEAFERAPGGEYTYRRMEKAPNRGHHRTKTLPPEFFK